MYNIYIEEKNQRQAKELEKEKLRRLNYTQRYKRDQSSLIFNYNARVKDFILDMATSEFSLPQKNVDKPVLNTRLQYIQEMKDKIKGRRGFLFFGYKSEKDRINEAVEYNKIYTSSIPLDLQGHKSQSQSPTQRNKSKCNQPQMRFKPKSNIERVREAVNLNYFGKVESEIINGQLSSIRAKVKKRMFGTGNSSLYMSGGGNSNSNDNNINIKEDENAFVIIPNMKKKIPQLKYTPMPIRRIIKDYDYNLKHNIVRTHFKAVESIALNEMNLFHSSIDKRKNAENLRLLSNNSAPGNILFDFEEKNINENGTPYSLISNRSHTNIGQRYDRFIKHKNPNNKKEISFDNSADLDHLKQIAFMAGDINKSSININEVNKGKLISAEDIRMHEDKVTIGSETFGVQTELKKIACKVLNKCNVHYKKDKNNSTKLEARKGKLMATHGLTIKDFLSKYNLPG